MAIYQSQFKGTEIDEKLAAVDECARIDGSYENLGAGTAEQLVSSVVINDKVPYNFRTSGGSIDIGNRKTEKLVGGTVAWNQLIKNGNFASVANWTATRTTYTVANNEATVVVTTASDPYIQQSYASVANHKYLLSVDVKRESGSAEIRCVAYYNGTANNSYKILTSASGWETLSLIVSNTTAGNNLLRITEALSNIAVNDSFKIRNAICVDLTQLFGSAIADHIYALETATAGAGVALFRSLFPKPYYSYNAGQLLSVKTSKAISVGFNAYDNSTGKAKVVGGNVYQITGAYTALSLDGETITPDSNGKFTPSESGELTVTGGNATNTCVHLVWDGERDGEYEPYKTYEYALDSDLELRGVPKLDANDNIYYDGDTYDSDGIVARKFGFVTFNGSEYWTLQSVNSYGIANFYITVTNLASGASKGLISDKLMKQTSGIADTQTEGILASSSNTLYVRIKSTTASTASAFKTWLSSNNISVVYELATPTTEAADPYLNPMIVDDFGTEEFVDERDVAVPVGHDTDYMANLRAKLEMSPNSPDGDGDYIVRQTDGVNSYVPLVIPAELPTAPTTDGTYKLTVTVADGVATYQWVSN